MANKIYEGRVAVITGAAQGIGLEIARRLAEGGAAVILNDSDHELALRAAEDIAKNGSVCSAFPGDAGDIGFTRSIVHQAVSQFGGIHLVIANAGLSLYGSFLEYSPDDFQRVLRLNLQGSFFLAQTAAARMIKQQSGGSILFMSSVSGHQALKNLAAYAMTKAALEMLAKNLVPELAPFDISVNALAPGATLTERTRGYADYEQAWSEITPMGRPATVGDIAHAALFLLHPASRHITGQHLIVDGGWTSVSPSPPDK